MRAYISIFKLRLINGMQYRVAALAGVATQFFWGFMYIMIYKAFYANAVQPPSISLEQLTAYTWLQQAFLALVALWLRDGEIFNLITSGNIAYELCRPCGIYGFWYAKLLAQRLSAASLRCSPILLVAFLLPKPYRMALPSDLISLYLFAVCLVLGLLVVVSISMLIYISVFFTMSPAGSLLMISTVGEFFAGLVIPIPLMPPWLQKIVYILPFRLTVDLPFRVYSGSIQHGEALMGILMQLLWLVILVALGNFTLSRALRRVIVQGG